MEYLFSGILIRYCKKTESTNFVCKAASGDASQRAEANVPVPAQCATQDDDSVQDELHVNLWEVGSESDLDIGIMIADWRSISSIQVDLPWRVERKDVSDLGVRLNSEKIVAAIFNEVVGYRGHADQNYVEISFGQDGGTASDRQSGRSPNRFFLIRLSPNAFHVDVLHSADEAFFSRLLISLPKDLEKSLENCDAKKIYIRFRVKSVPRKAYASVFRQKDRSLLSSSVETRIVDFRINVRRGVPDEVLSVNSEEIRFPDFKKIHFFLTVDRTQVCDFQSKNFVGCRSLVDEEEWSEYIKTKSPIGIEKIKSVREYLGYQWTEKMQKSKSSTGEEEKSVKDLTVLGRFSGSNSDAWQIFRFICIGLIFGMVGNALWDILKPAANSGEYWKEIAKQYNSVVLMVAAMVVAFLLMVVPFGRVWGFAKTVWSKWVMSRLRKAGRRY